jgi:hypothetical protein
MSNRIVFTSAEQMLIAQGKVDQVVGRVAAEIGLRSEAVFDAAARAKDLFELSDTGVQPLYETSLKRFLRNSHVGWDLLESVTKRLGA